MPKAVAAKPLPAPKGEPVLRIKGVKSGNVSAKVTAVDFATLDQAASDKLTIVEPFVKRKMTFTRHPDGRAAAARRRGPGGPQRSICTRSTTTTSTCRSRG